MEESSTHNSIQFSSIQPSTTGEMNDCKHPRKRIAPSKTPRRVRLEVEADKKEQILTSLVFVGNGQVNNSPTSRRSLKGATDETTFQATLLPSVNDSAKDPGLCRGPVWKDLDDCAIQVSTDSEHRLTKLRHSRNDSNWKNNELELRLRQRCEKTTVATACTKWADGKDAPTDHDTEAGLLFSPTGNLLPPNVIDIVRLKDANAEDPCSAVLRCAKFYQASVPDEPLLMTAGLDHCMRFYQINTEDEIKKIHGIHCKFIPV